MIPGSKNQGGFCAELLRKLSRKNLQCTEIEKSTDIEYSVHLNVTRLVNDLFNPVNSQILSTLPHRKNANVSDKR